MVICEHLLKISDHQNGKLREPRVEATRLVSEVTPWGGYSMVKDSASNIKDSLAGNLDKICYAETESYGLTGRLTEIRGDELWFTRRNGSVWLVSRKALLALHPIRGQ